MAHSDQPRGTVRVTTETTRDGRSVTTTRTEPLLPAQTRDATFSRGRR